MVIDRGTKIDDKMYKANINLQNKCKDLEYELAISNKKLQKIKEFCEAVNDNYPESKSFASRILFMIDNQYDDYE